MARLQIKAFSFVAVVLALAAARVPAQIVITGNENKIDLMSGAPKVIPPTGPDSISILDFSKFPPAVEHLMDVPNSVVGPPSNIAITKDRKLALIANSLKVDPGNPTNWVPENFIHVVELSTKPAKVIGKVTTGRQPSGMSIAPNGKLALVANRAEGTVSVLSIRGREISVVQTVTVCLPAESASDVAISPGGIKGKCAKMPVYQLIGGKSRFAVDCYTHCSGRDLQELEASVKKGIEDGFRHIRIQLGAYGSPQLS